MGAPRTSTRPARRYALPPVALVLLLFAASARAEEANQWLARVAKAARELSYVGTVVYQRGTRVESSRLVHLYDGGKETEKLVSLDGPAREVIRNMGEVRTYFPDAQVVRVEPRTFRNAFPSVSSEQQKSLAQFYDFRALERERVGGHIADVVAFEPRDGLRYGHRFWSDVDTGLLLKARMVNDRGEVVEQFAFTDVQVNAKIEQAMVEPSWPKVPPEWRVKQLSAGDVEVHETGWGATRVPAGFGKIMEGYRKLQGRKNPVAHIVFSDGLVAISVFIEPFATASVPLGMRPGEGGLNVYSVKQDDNVVTVMGEVPPATVRQIGNSVARR